MQRMRSICIEVKKYYDKHGKKNALYFMNLGMYRMKKQNQITIAAKSNLAIFFFCDTYKEH